MWGAFEGGESAAREGQRQGVIDHRGGRAQSDPFPLPERGPRFAAAVLLVDDGVQVAIKGGRERAAIEHG